MVDTKRSRIGAERAMALLWNNRRDYDHAHLDVNNDDYVNSM